MKITYLPARTAKGALSVSKWSAQRRGYSVKTARETRAAQAKA